MHRHANAVPGRGGVGEKDPIHQVKRVQCPRSPEGQPMGSFPRKRESTAGARRRLAPTTVVPAQTGIQFALTWTPALRQAQGRLFAGVTRAAVFISMDGPQVHGRSVEGWRRPGEIRLGELLSPPEQSHNDKEIGKIRTPEPRTRWYRVESRTRWYGAEFRSVGWRTIEYGWVATMATEKTRTRRGERSALPA
jgi:hypothetical protein